AGTSTPSPLRRGQSPRLRSLPAPSSLRRCEPPSSLRSWDNLRRGAGHPREARYDRQDALARAEQDVLLEAGRAVRAGEETLMRIAERARDQLGRDRGVGALGADQRDDAPRAVGIVERECAL